MGVLQDCCLSSYHAFQKLVRADPFKVESCSSSAALQKARNTRILNGQNRIKTWTSQIARTRIYLTYGLWENAARGASKMGRRSPLGKWTLSSLCNYLQVLCFVTI